MKEDLNLWPDVKKLHQAAVKNKVAAQTKSTNYSKLTVVLREVSYGVKW